MQAAAAPKAVRASGPEPPRAFFIHSPWITTMPRCARLLPLGAVALAAALLAAPASAQVSRRFPATALRGTIEFGTPPNIVLDGDAALLSPGARIHGQNNMLALTGALVGTTSYTVDYTVESTGLVSEVWLLTAAETAVQPWPETAKQAAAWNFDWTAQVWTRP